MGRIVGLDGMIRGTRSGRSGSSMIPDHSRMGSIRCGTCTCMSTVHVPMDRSIWICIRMYLEVHQVSAQITPIHVVKAVQPTRDEGDPVLCHLWQRLLPNVAWQEWRDDPNKWHQQERGGNRLATRRYLLAKTKKELWHCLLAAVVHLRSLFPYLRTTRQFRDSK